LVAMSAKSWSVGSELPGTPSVDQAGGYEALTGTEKALQQMDANRKAQQVKEAAKNSDSPQL
jgi:hypothetical protein